VTENGQSDDGRQQFEAAIAKLKARRAFYEVAVALELLYSAKKREEENARQEDLSVGRLRQLLRKITG